MITWHNIHKGLCYSKQIFSQRIENTTYWLFKCFDSFTAICNWGRWNIHKQWANLIGSEAEFDCRKRSPVCPFVCLSFCLSGIFPKSAKTLAFGRWELGNIPVLFLYTHVHAQTQTLMLPHALARHAPTRAGEINKSGIPMMNTYAHAKTHKHANARTRPRTHTRTHTHARAYTYTNVRPK